MATYLKFLDSNPVGRGGGGGGGFGNSGLRPFVADDKTRRIAGH